MIRVNTSFTSISVKPGPLKNFPKETSLIRITSYNVCYTKVLRHHHWIDTAQQAILRPSGMSQDAEFGASVLIEGDTVIVGAPYRVFDGVDSGGVYLFEKPLQGWQNSVENAILHLSNPAAGSEFGQSIALSGDLMLIGASGVSYNFV